MDMLLDYASDDDDDAHPSPVVASSSPVNSLLVPFTTPIAAPLPPPAPSLLPSAAQLFDAPASTTAASSSPSLPRKRPQVNGSAHPSHQPKVARSTSSSARTPPGSTLVPPQLRGRSNVATEDLDKLFVQRQQRRLE
ncbi:hypothetical protein M758_11G001100 [Ceratodon purpureus]|nr:hypothetical protein M758_11G001100 [Ceratodon purpureus]